MPPLKELYQIHYRSGVQARWRSYSLPATSVEEAIGLFKERFGSGHVVDGCTSCHDMEVKAFPLSSLTARFWAITFKRKASAKWKFKLTETPVQRLVVAGYTEVEAIEHFYSPSQKIWKKIKPKDVQVLSIEVLLLTDKITA